MLRLVTAVHRHAEVISLLLGELSELHADFFQVQSDHFLVELLWQAINRDLVGVLAISRHRD